MNNSANFQEKINKTRSNFSVNSLLEFDQDQLVYNFFGCNIEDSDTFILIDAISELNNALNLIEEKISFGVNYDHKTSDYCVGSKKITDNECNLKANRVLSEIVEICNLTEKSNNFEEIRVISKNVTVELRCYF
jgi:hypothetical protein